MAGTTNNCNLNRVLANPFLFLPFESSGWHNAKDLRHPHIVQNAFVCVGVAFVPEGGGYRMYVLCTTEMCGGPPTNQAAPSEAAGCAAE